MPPTPRTRILGAALRDARVEANYGLRELARRIGIAPAILSSWEQAHRAPSLADVAGILGATGTAGETKRDILRLARGAAGESWVLRSAPLSLARSAALLAHKLAAQHVVTWDPVAIPELLQVLDRNLEPRSTVIEAFICDQALHAENLHTDAQRRQLRSLVQLAKVSRLFTVRTVCSDPAWDYGLTTAFDRYSMPTGETVIYCGQRSLGVFITERDTPISSHEADTERLREIAKEPRDSINECIAALRSAATPRHQT
ncbi:helix-turn-helix domain-containing protein [Amycolatopsis nivea]